MRSVWVYLPATWADLASSELSPRPAHAPLDALRAGTTGEDLEVAEYEAFCRAAASCPDRLGPDDVPSRVVVSARLPLDSLAPGGTGEPTSVLPTRPVDWGQVASIHVDEAAVGPLVTRARTEPEAREDLEDVDLLWYDVTERADLLADGPP